VPGPFSKQLKTVVRLMVLAVKEDVAAVERVATTLTVTGLVTVRVRIEVLARYAVH